jgi:uncharacterized protein
MDKRVSVTTLGVADGVDDESDHIAFFQAGCLIVSVWDRRKLASDSGVEDKGSWAGDPDGHSWEVADNPAWTLRDDGSVSLGRSG